MSPLRANERAEIYYMSLVMKYLKYQEDRVIMRSPFLSIEFLLFNSELFLMENKCLAVGDILMRTKFSKNKFEE
jgi:hypothetical protein